MKIAHLREKMPTFTCAGELAWTGTGRKRAGSRSCPYKLVAGGKVVEADGTVGGLVIVREVIEQAGLVQRARLDLDPAAFQDAFQLPHRLRSGRIAVGQSVSVKGQFAFFFFGWRGRGISWGCGARPCPESLNVRLGG